MKVRVTPTQQKYLRLVERGQALLNEAERLRATSAKNCKHPNEFSKVLFFDRFAIGDWCTFCKQARYIDGQWGPQAVMEAEAKRRCTHPKAFLSDYTWEHDNGYGRQSQVVGELCGFCSAKKSWKNMGTWTTAEQQRRNRERERDD